MIDDAAVANREPEVIRARQGAGDSDRLLADAAVAARAAAEKHNLHVVELRDLDEHLTVTDLLCHVWRAEDPAHVVSADLVHAFAHSGNYVAGVYLDRHLVGASIGFFGAGHLHSHVTGVDPTRQGRGIGFALKQHQRWWALRRGVSEVRWTFDPLVRRNAYFNIHKLGATATEYLPQFYGPLLDGLNAGDDSDRIYVSWDLTAPRTVAAAGGQPIDAGAGGSDPVPLLDLVDDQPRLTGKQFTAASPGGRAAVVATPPDIDRLRQREPALAQQWRSTLRTVLGGAMAAGYHIVDLRRDGCYVLEVP